MARITGSNGTDLLNGTSGADHIEGFGGNDWVYAGAGDDLVQGGDGDDRIESQGGSDRLEGEADNDWIWIVQATTLGQRVVALGGAGKDEISFSLSGAGGGTIEADGGEGDDILRVMGLTSSSALLTLGQGQDVIRFDTGYRGLGQGTIAVADLEAGAAGDWIDWDGYLHQNLAGWDRQGNPFTAGYLRLVQDGPDTLFQIDVDGAAGTAAYATLIRFSNVAAGALTAENLGGFDPGGGPLVGRTIAGTAAADTIRGSAGGDLIEGVGGNDTIFGAHGHDTLRGGDGDDSLRGDNGNDLVEGGAGADYLEGGAGDDVLFGGEGNDTVSNVGGGVDELHGGEGDDSLSFSHSSSAAVAAGLVSGGIGDDFISIFFSAVNGTVTVDAGSGADVVTLVSVYGSAASLTLGEGRDIVRLSSNMSTEGSAVIEDFAAGPDGDTLDWLSYLGSALVGWDGGRNPFAAGYARLVQSGADTLLQVAPDAGTPFWDVWGGYETLLTFRNVVAGSLTPANLGGYASDGSAPPPMTLTGTDGADALSGGTGSDLIEGGGGDDILSGGAGHDTLRGGASNDTLNGEIGNDRLEGGDGADVLDGGHGQDRVYGGRGNDRLVSQQGVLEELHGEAGDDTLLVSHFGGEWGTEGDKILATGGAGNDSFSLSMYSDSLTMIEGGTGADTVNLQTLFRASVAITLGAGRDTIWVAPHFNRDTGSVSVTDFTGGPRGDNLDWSDYLADRLRGWNPAANPFRTGHLALVQDGADLVVQVDNDGLGTGSGPTTLARFRDVDLDALDASNFDGWDPHVWQIITGTVDADTLTGGAGHDRIDGGAGADTMAGGALSDTYLVDHAGDVVTEEAGGGLADEVRTGLGTRAAPFILAPNVEKLVGTSAAGQGLRGNGLDNAVTASGGNDFVDLRDGGDDDVATGAGRDVLYYGAALGTGDRNDAGDAGGDARGDLLILQGDYDLLLGAENLVGVEKLRVLRGTNTDFGEAGTSVYSYALTTVDENVAAGGRLVVQGGSLQAGETLSFDGAAESDGSFQLFGGRGADVLRGGANADHLLGRAGDDLLAGNGGDDRLRGGFGRDRLEGGGGSDIFVLAAQSGAEGYANAVAESTGASRDLLVGFDFAEDRIDLPVGVSVLFTDAAGALSEVSFDADLAAALGAFAPGAAIVFTPDAGDLAGRHFLVVDADANGAYQTGADFVFELESPAGPAPLAPHFLI